jgi:hypothetical protein
MYSTGRPPVIVEEHRDFVVDGVVLQQKLALVAEVFLDELVGDALEPQGHHRTVHRRELFLVP